MDTVNVSGVVRADDKNTRINLSILRLPARSYSAGRSSSTEIALFRRADDGCRLDHAARPIGERLFYNRNVDAAERDGCLDTPWSECGLPSISSATTGLLG